MKKIIFLLVFFSLWVFVYITFMHSSHSDYPEITTISDKDNDGINDIDDILQGARQEVKNKTVYKDWYFAWWFPPDGQWVCSDVIWRAFKNAWYNLKNDVDKDIQAHVASYPRVNGKPEPNIDFRRVMNLHVYFQKYSQNLTLEVIKNDKNNLEQWQPGDIVIFWKPKDHIAIISDKRNKYWVPYIIHNASHVAKEEDMLLYWHENISPIIGHFRLKYDK